MMELLAIDVSVCHMMFQWSCHGVTWNSGSTSPPSYMCTIAAFHKTVLFDKNKNRMMNE